MKKYCSKLVITTSADFDSISLLRSGIEGNPPNECVDIGVDEILKTCLELIKSYFRLKIAKKKYPHSGEIY